jgi:hypothetical protein
LILDGCLWHAAYHGNGLFPGNTKLTRTPKLVTRNTLNPTHPSNPTYAVTRKPPQYFPHPKGMGFYAALTGFTFKNIYTDFDFYPFFSNSFHNSLSTYLACLSINLIILFLFILDYFFSFLQSAPVQMCQFVLYWHLNSPFHLFLRQIGGYPRMRWFFQDHSHSRKAS